MSRRQIDLDALRESNRRWLAPHGLLERPWFILASGPDPTIPPDITGRALLIFPEGTRSRDGSLQKARDGLAMLALRTGATIVPIGVADTDKVWPK